MSDKKKIILVGVGLAAAATTVATLGFFLSREKSLEMTAENNGRSAIENDAAVHERKGKITSILNEGTNISIFSEEGSFSFSASESSIIGTDGTSLFARDLVIGMEIEATVKRNMASSIRIKSIPPLAVISPTRGSITDLDFNIKGIVYADGEKICLTLSNRRTGVVYKNQFSAPIDTERKFSIPVNLSIAIDAASKDMIDAALSVCGSDESVAAEWEYHPGLTSRIKVYFLKNSCDNLYAVERVILAERSWARASLDELFRGPNAKEVLDGIFTSANPSERVRDIEIESNIVYLDFYPTILNTERCDVATLKSQITKTLNQFPIGEFAFTIEGKKENPLN